MPQPPNGPPHKGIQSPFTKSDTDGEVIFAGSSALTYRVFGDLPNVNHAYLRLRHQYQK
jgi:hypothetical protein